MRMVMGGSGGVGWWSGDYAQAAMAADFVNDQYMANNMVLPAITDLFSITRASVGTAVDTDGVLSSFASGIMRRTDKGILIEEARKNICLQTEALSTTWTATSTTLDAFKENYPFALDTLFSISALEGRGLSKLIEAMQDIIPNSVISLI